MSEHQELIMAKLASQEGSRQLAYNLFAKGKYEEAIQLYRKVLDLSPQDIRKADICLELGWLLYEVSRRTEAQTLAQNALLLISNQPQDLESLLNLGAAHALLAHCLSFTDPNASAESGRMGLEALGRVMSESSGSEQIVSAYSLAARIHNLLGNTDETVALCEKWLQHKLGERERLECMMVLAEALRCEERFQEAEQAIECARRYIGTDKECREADKRISQRLALECGLIQRQSNRFADAIETFKRILVVIAADPALCNDPSISGTVWWNLAATLYETSDYEGAAAAFESALVLHPQNEPNYFKILLSLGDCYLGMKVYPEARKSYEKVIASAHSSDVDKLKACTGVAKVLYELGEYTQAASAFETLLPDYSNNDPEHYNLLLWLGNCYEAMKVNAKARDCYESVIVAPSSWGADKASAENSLIRLSSSGGSQDFH
jgi:tetratricopeptide (TPR) repeat protein